MKLADILFGRPLASEDDQAERIGPAKGVPVFGLDALSSAAYGPEAALTLLIALGMGGVHFIRPITLSIVILLGIVYFSYRQTIMAYPQGGGSYTVASQNLGRWPGLLAAAALMIDYILTAAVGISAGVGALVSAVPSLQQHTLGICLAILVILTLINVRGVRETGGLFMVPTYIFIACLLGMIAIGLVKAMLAGGHPVPVIAPPRLTHVTAAVSLWLILRAFASGCTAMTGVEAVSNGVMAFREPTDKTARLTLTIVIAILVVMLGGIAFLCRAVRHRRHRRRGRRAIRACSRNCSRPSPGAARFTGPASCPSSSCCRCRRIQPSRIFRDCRGPLRTTDSCRTRSPSVDDGWSSRPAFTRWPSSLQFC